jgi:hypothetical protein
MNTSELSLVPLQLANLCLDCEMITAGQTHCSACGSVALMNLARTLNGNATAEQSHQELFVVKRNSPRPKPAAFKSIGPNQLPISQSKYANLRNVLTSVLVRPVRHALAIKYGN